MLLRDTNNKGRAHFSQPLQDYLWLLGNSTECHTVLIIFSDGERETPLPINLVRRNNRGKEVGVACSRRPHPLDALYSQVQIFTFLVGGGPDHANLKAVACENRGLNKLILWHVSDTLYTLGRMGEIREYFDIIPAVLVGHMTSHDHHMIPSEADHRLITAPHLSSHSLHSIQKHTCE